MKIESLPLPAALQNGLEILAKWDLREALMGYKKPASFLFGRLDTITPAKTMAVMESNFPLFNYIMFPKAAHMPFLSHQIQFIEILKELIP